MILAIIIWCDVGCPILFIQDRIGKNGRKFKLIKFRTIKGNTHNDLILDDDVINKRTSVIGKFMRLHCLDELPQFFNVITGDMSVVGPRPTIKAHFVKFNTRRKIRSRLHSVKPGVTGAGQIIMSKKEFSKKWTPNPDLDYIKKISLPKDIGIIIKTIWVVIRGH